LTFLGRPPFFGRRLDRGREERNGFFGKSLDRGREGRLGSSDFVHMA